MRNIDTRCGQDSDSVKLFTMCDLDKHAAPEIVFASAEAPAGGFVKLTRAAISDVRDGELLKVNWYTSESVKTHDPETFEHHGTITRQAYFKGKDYMSFDIPVEWILRDMGDAKFFIMKLLNVNRCY